MAQSMLMQYAETHMYDYGVLVIVYRKSGSWALLAMLSCADAQEKAERAFGTS